jgi:anti-sigma factor RsiW
VTRWIPCRDFVEFLDDYLSGRLSGQTLDEFNNHLAGCPPCVAYMQTYVESVRLGRAVLEKTAEAVPADVPEKLVQAILAARERGGTS